MEKRLVKVVYHKEGKTTELGTRNILCLVGSVSDSKWCKKLNELIPDIEPSKFKWCKINNRLTPLIELSDGTLFTIIRVR